MMRDEHPVLAALMVAFGLKGLLHETERQFNSARDLATVSRQLGQTVQSVVEATDEAGEFDRAE